MRLRWLSGLLRRLRRGKREKTAAGSRLVWATSVPTQSQLPIILRSLPGLMPAGSVVYLEGNPAPSVQSYLESCASDGVSTAGGDEHGDFIAHMALTAENLNGLAELAERHHSAHDIAYYLHVLRDSKLLFEWWDLPDNFILISKDFGEEEVMAFCSQVGLQCAEREVWAPG